MATFTKLATIPEKGDAKPAEGWINVLNFKTIKSEDGTTSKESSVAYHLPDLFEQFDPNNPRHTEFVVALFRANQADDNRDIHTRDILDSDVLVDLDKAISLYFSDGRKGSRDGVKQAEIEAWIRDSLYPTILTRVARSLGNRTKLEQVLLAASLRDYFLLAATRSGSKENKSVTGKLLTDLKQRLSLYSDAGDLDASSPEFKALAGRIDTHIAKTTQSIEILDQF